MFEAAEHERPQLGRVRKWPCMVLIQNPRGTPDEIVGRQVHSKSFRVVLRHCATKERIAFFARHGDSGIDESSRMLKLAATCADANYKKLPVTVSISNDISDYMKSSKRLGSATLDPPRTAKWLFLGTVGHPYFLAFTSPGSSFPVALRRPTYQTNN